MRLLIIDDEADVRAIVGRSLERNANTKVTQAATAAEGLRLATTSPPDAILLDVVMPGMDGLAVRAALENDPQTREIPVIFLTGTSDDTELHTLRQQSLGVIRKPINLRTFNDEVMRLLGHKPEEAPRLPSLEDLRDRFIRGSESRLQSLAFQISILEGEPRDLESLDLLLRGFHSLAGIGTTHGFPKVTVLARAAEKRCNELLKAKASVSSADIDELRALTDSLSSEFSASDHPTGPADDPEKPAAYNVLLAVSDHASKTLLRERGMRVRTAATIAEAVTAIDAALPEALIVESDLPDGIGYQIIERLRAKGGRADTLALVVGGSSGFLDKVEAIRCGADGFFEDPVDWDAVIRRVELHKEHLATEAPRICLSKMIPSRRSFSRQCSGRPAIRFWSVRIRKTSRRH
ncbi:MAG TPA: response regulator [Thermoanaerobaculia bacterium]|nr:response regulator [Thermoanaerobaculia bacterium]